MPTPLRAGQAFAVVAAAAVLGLAAAGCKHSSSTSTDTLSSIILSNACGATVTVYLDGLEKATLDTGSLTTLSGLTAGSRLVEAKKTDDGFVVFSETMILVPSATLYLTIRGGASVRVTNQYGEILRIYEGDALVGDIGDQITLTIGKVGFGSHTYQARKLSDPTVVAEFTIEVTDFSQFAWTITP